MTPNKPFTLAVLLFALGGMALVTGMPSFAHDDRDRHHNSHDSRDDDRSDHGDDDRGDDGDKGGYSAGSSSSGSYTGPGRALYMKECGDCHVPYAARMLPARSWERLLGNLEDHFGDNAELDILDRQDIGDYLVAKSADHRKKKSRWMKGIKSRQAPLRITDARYFKKEHKEVPRRFFREHPDALLSQCDTCHTKADKGSYKERDIVIPGIGRWED